jgi:hypothetical protein
MRSAGRARKRGAEASEDVRDAVRTGQRITVAAADEVPARTMTRAGRHHLGQHPGHRHRDALQCHHTGAGQPERLSSEFLRHGRHEPPRQPELKNESDTRQREQQRRECRTGPDRASAWERVTPRGSAEGAAGAFNAAEDR